MQKKFEKKLNITLKIILSLLIAALVLPFSIIMPASDLDPSWVLGLIQAQSQNLQFGQNIVFTYGPYSFLSTHAYHPDLASLIWFSAALLTLMYVALCWKILKYSHSTWLIALVGLFCFLIRSQEIILLMYPLFFGLYVYQQSKNSVMSLSKIIQVAFFSIALGLLVLTKGSNTILSLGVLSLCSVLLVYQRRYLILFLCCFSFVIGCVFFWVIAKQNPMGLLTFFSNIFELSAGYTEVMAWGSKTHEVILFLIGWCCLLILLSCHIKNKADRLFLMALFSLFLFICFKGSYVRHDTGHKGLAYSALLISTVLCFTVFSPLKNKEASRIPLKKITIIHLVSLTLLTSLSIYDIAKREWFSPYLSELATTLKYLTIDNSKLKTIYDSRLNAIAQQNPLPTLEGTSDIYEHDQAFLIASKNAWNPRPIFQSYSAYTPKLAQLNQAHLLSNRAPDHVFFTVSPIDNRYPSLNDGLSWTVLLQRYRPSPTQTEDFLILDRASNAQIFVPPVNINEQNAKIGEVVSMPMSAINDERPIFVELHIQPNLFGKIAETLYKTSALMIEVQLDNGQTKQHRIFANMTQTDFLLSPYISSQQDFAALYLNQPHNQSRLPRVTHFKVLTNKEGGWVWQPEYQIVFKQ